MNRTPEPDWDSINDPIPSVDVARLFGLKPKSLQAYVRRNQLAAPIRREPNMAWYAKADVRAFWRLRAERSVQFYSLNDLPAPLRSEAVSAAVAALAGADTALVAGDRGETIVSPAELSEAIEKGISTGVRAGMADVLAPLTQEVAGLREELAAVRQQLTEARQEGKEAGVTGWRQRLHNLWRG